MGKYKIIDQYLEIEPTEEELLRQFLNEITTEILGEPGDD